MPATRQETTTSHQATTNRTENSTSSTAEISDPHATLSPKPKREQGPHSNVKTS